jgi:hypothetical protein
MPETHIDIDGPQDLVLSLETTATADELWSRWQYLSELAQKAGQHMNDTGQRWKETTDPVAKRSIWAEYETEAREFRVLVSWKDLFYAAYIFTTDGAHCAALDDSPPLG